MYYDMFDTGWIGTLTLVGDEEGLRRIGFHNDRYPMAILPEWIRRPDFFVPVKTQLASYFEGNRTRFDIPLCLAGTPFQLKVWRSLQDIPYGAVVSYQTIAETIGTPKAVRAVGGANAKNPIPLIIPCHRVIGKDGSLTGFGGGLEIKKRLIDLERATISRKTEG